MVVLVSGEGTMIKMVSVKSFEWRVTISDPLFVTTSRLVNFWWRRFKQHLEIFTPSCYSFKRSADHMPKTCETFTLTKNSKQLSYHYTKLSIHLSDIIKKCFFSTFISLSCYLAWYPADEISMLIWKWLGSKVHYCIPM